MSRKYEGLIVLNTKGIDSSLEDLIKDIGNEIESEGAKLEEVKQMGRQTFAYPSKKADGGHYVNYHFSAEPDAIAKIQTKLKLNKAIYLQHYQTL